jgi:predicted nucleotidyltransferase component of viral defense system
MDFGKVVSRLAAMGYKRAAARAKIAHDVVLAAIRSSGMKGFVTIKGGVVMSSLTDVARRATMDMDLDFVHYPLANDAIRRFVSGLKRVAPCRIRVSGKIETLRQQEYKGKRIHLTLVDEEGFSIGTKIDIGVHARTSVGQTVRVFKVVVDDSEVPLLVNPNEQIFVEKLKSLLRFGSASTRFKDIFDMYYLSRRTKRAAVRKLLKEYIFDDAKMKENTVVDIKARLDRIFGNKMFMRNLSRPVNAWLDVPPEEAAASITAFISSLE